jgi:acetolactate synthase I/III small subunit
VRIQREGRGLGQKKKEKREEDAHHAHTLLASPHGLPPFPSLSPPPPCSAAVRDIGQLFGAEVVDVGSRHIIFQLTSWSRRIDAFVRMLEPWGIIEVARSGVVALLRSPVAGSLADQIRTPKEANNTPDASQLPPG